MDNHIITAGYVACGYCKTRPAYQYDYGQVLQLDGFGEMLPNVFEMHFSIGAGQAITRIGSGNTVEIPNVCLERYGTVTAWLFLHDGDDDGETKYVIEIPVRSRAKVTDQEPTPEEQSVIEQAIALLNSAVEETAQDVIDAGAAKDAAETAQGKAEDAQDAAEDAQDAAEAAQAAAETAGSGAEENALKAEGYAVGKQNGTEVSSGEPYYHNNALYYQRQAANHASTAATEAYRAEGYKTAANSRANDAYTYSRNAEASKTAAAADALKAEGFALGKQNGEDVDSESPYYEANAKYYKEQAAGSATTAGTKAGEASGSATSAAADALKAEGYAVGKQGGAAVASGSPYYHNNAAYYADQASGSASTASEAAASAEEVLESIPSDYSELSDDVSTLKSAITQSEVEDLLLRDELPGTTTTVTMNSSGKPASIVYSANGSTVRTDAFAWSADSVTETRTAFDKYITITTNLKTLAQTISDIQEVA